jgi:phosphoglycerol transferase MdoB-like AlkP superfamily enzyme
MKKIILFVLAILGWLTLIVRLYLRITESDFSPLESTIQFFSYFTILTNLLVTIYCTAQLSRLGTGTKNNRPESLTALTVFIIIVGIVYHVALKPIWNPEGLQMILSEIHHTIVPFGAALLWILNSNKNAMDLKRLLLWFIYPIIYISFVLLRGDYSNFYPYPFLNVNELGFPSVIKNSLLLLGIMIIMLVGFYLIGSKWKKKTVANKV